MNFEKILAEYAGERLLRKESRGLWSGLKGFMGSQEMLWFVKWLQKVYTQLSYCKNLRFAYGD